MRQLFAWMLGCNFCLSAAEIYVPASYTTLSGGDNALPVQNLQNLTAIGMDISFTSLQFEGSTAGGPYSGYRSYFIPSETHLTAIKVFANYKGTQAWTWEIFDWVYKGWVTIGTNAMAIDEGPWSVLNLNRGGPCANYVNPKTGELRIGFFSNESAAEALLNYEAIALTSGPSSTVSYFIAPTGDDANPGTVEAPWETLSNAAQAVKAGSTVYVPGGIYSEQVVFKVSENAGAGSITFMSYPGEVAIIDGTGVKLPDPYYPAGLSPSSASIHIFYAGSQGVLISNPFSSPLMSLDYNVYYTPKGKSAQWEWNNKSYTTFNSYQTASG